MKIGVSCSTARSDIASKTYSGKAMKPLLKVTYGGKTPKRGADNSSFSYSSGRERHCTQMSSSQPSSLTPEKPL